jgi:hypothetical protein
MTDTAADLRLVYGPNAAKKIARRFGIAVVTAKLWLAGRAPSAREREIARALIAECDRLEGMIAGLWNGRRSRPLNRNAPPAGVCRQGAKRLGQLEKDNDRYFREKRK